MSTRRFEMIKLEKYTDKYKDAVQGLMSQEMMDHTITVDDHKDYMVLALEGQDLVGLGAYDGPRGIIDPFIYVMKAYRLRGIGRQLMNFIEGDLKSYDRVVHGQLAVKDSYQNVIAFLYKMGYYDWMIGDWMTYKGPKFNHKPICVRNYEEKDFDVYHRIESTTMFLLREGVGASHNYYHPPNDYQKKYQLSRAKDSFILEVDHQVVGVGDLSDNELEGVCICPSQQNKGYGTEFVKFLLNQLLDRGHSELLLEAMQGNPSRSLYERLGFKDSYKIHYMVKFYGEDPRQKVLPEAYQAYVQ